MNSPGPWPHIFLEIFKERRRNTWLTLKRVSTMTDNFVLYVAVGILVVTVLVLLMLRFVTLNRSLILLFWSVLHWATPTFLNTCFARIRCFAPRILPLFESYFPKVPTYYFVASPPFKLFFSCELQQPSQECATKCSRRASRCGEFYRVRKGPMWFHPGHVSEVWAVL